MERNTYPCGGFLTTPIPIWFFVFIALGGGGFEGDARLDRRLPKARLIPSSNPLHQFQFLGEWESPPQLFHIITNMLGKMKGCGSNGLLL